MTSRGRLPAIALALLVTGCQNDPPRVPPKTYPVTGKVLHADGKPVEGGMVEFVGLGSPPLNATAEIQTDGTFSLSTLGDAEKLPGAVEGTYQVTIIAGKLEDHGKVPVALPAKYTVEPKENHFELRLPR